MEVVLKDIAGNVALATEIVYVLCIALGASIAAFAGNRLMWSRTRSDPNSSAYTKT